MKIHGEIIYTNAQGETVHSDICPKGCLVENISVSYTEALHKALDEWLTLSGGTGTFYLKQEGYSEEQG